MRNLALKIWAEYKGTSRVKTPFQYGFKEDNGLDKLREKVVTPLSKLILPH